MTMTHPPIDLIAITIDRLSTINITLLIIINTLLFIIFIFVLIFIADTRGYS
jgi:hypothetical protein